MPNLELMMLDEYDRQLIKIMLRTCRAETLQEVYEVHPEIASTEDLEYVSKELKEAMQEFQSVVNRDFKILRPDVQERIIHTSSADMANWITKDDPRLKFHKVQPKKDP